jgi:uncharacterized protein (DUF1501 family)
MKRRDWLRTMTLASGAALLPLGQRGWAATSSAAGDQRRLIVLMLRGAVDGLSVVVPYGDDDYYKNRGKIALARPNGAGGLIDLDGHFGLHPALAPLLPRWADGSLAFVHASGSPAATRSHFEAQDFMESGTPGVSTTADGWMNRLLGVLPGTRHPTTAISLGNAQPRIMTGRNGVANVALGRGAARAQATDRPAVAAAFDSLYAGDDALSRTYHEGREARTDLLEAMHTDPPEDPKANGGAPSVQGFAQDAQQLARIMTRDARVRLAFLAVGGWDTHVNQGAAQGQLANRLRPLGEGLALLARNLGDVYRDTAIVVMSEFGRTAHENGNGGTDHGHGNAMWVMGGAVNGRKVYGEWPGLAPNSLHEARDLAVTTDFRAVLGTLCSSHLGLGDAAMEAVFPKAPAASSPVKNLLRA